VRLVSESHEHASPSEIDHRRGWFDELAASAENVVSRDVFFIVLVILTALWVPSYFLFHTLDYWYLAFAIPAEIVTLFMVALMANHSRRSERALHRKVDALAEALAVVIEGPDGDDVQRHATELRAAVGLEDRVSTDDD
jgi:low affinity Fe/Cu permease